MMNYTLPEWAKDQIHASVKIVLPFKDRLRVVFGAPIFLSIYTSTENEVGRTESQSNAHAGRLFRLRKKHGGYSPEEPRP
ncbi:hypothetical protein LCGC14_1544620 [marine sediment metagenome]|uniref:Uncharacterized protein n=1 Tax=marine sediment metagenome TaxID=412755 RepID=A0A0F9JCZ6_9ZZZZ